MEEEKRTEQRTAVDHEFNVLHESFGLRPCNSRDLSLSGLFVEGDFSHIGIGTTVGVSFTLPATYPLAAGKLFYLSAIVTRVTSDGAGLKFLDPDMETCTALMKLKDQPAG